MKILTILFVLTNFLILISGCGESPINIDEKTYSPKIVVEGYLFPGQKVENIRITRNFPLDREIELSEILITDAEVRLWDVENAKSYTLNYSPLRFSYEYNGSDLVIDFGKAYQIEITATVDNQKLYTTSTTRVPQKGFKIDDSKSSLYPLTYREKDRSGKIKSFVIAFQKSPETNFYVLSIVALDASQSTFIEDNSYGIKTDDLDDRMLDGLKYQYKWVEAVFEGFTIYYVDVPWVEIWFHGRYRVILYAGDKNFKDYFLTHNRIQDIDGNLYEPKFHFEGDGIGVFGSAITDTTFFEVQKN